MTNIEYETYMGKLVLCADLLQDVPFADMLNDLERIDALGPILDPTAYRDGMHNLPPQKELIRAGMAYAHALANGRAALESKAR